MDWCEASEVSSPLRVDPSRRGVGALPIFDYGQAAAIAFGKTPKTAPRHHLPTTPSRRVAFQPHDASRGSDRAADESATPPQRREMTPFVKTG